MVIEKKEGKEEINIEEKLDMVEKLSDDIMISLKEKKQRIKKI